MKDSTSFAVYLLHVLRQLVFFKRALYVAMHGNFILHLFLNLRM